MLGFNVCVYMKKKLFQPRKKDRVYKFDSLVEAEAWKEFLIRVERVHPKQVFIIKEVVA